MIISLKNAVYPAVATIALALVAWQPSAAVAFAQPSTAFGTLDMVPDDDGNTSISPAAPAAPSAATLG